MRKSPSTLQANAFVKTEEVSDPPEMTPEFGKAVLDYGTTIDRKKEHLETQKSDAL
jgi:hypothetical protein